MNHDAYKQYAFLTNLEIKKILLLDHSLLVSLGGFHERTIILSRIGKKSEPSVGFMGTKSRFCAWGEMEKVTD